MSRYQVWRVHLNRMGDEHSPVGLVRFVDEAAARDHARERSAHDRLGETVRYKVVDMTNYRTIARFTSGEEHTS